ncbi:hypothetical protein ACS0TY_032433 [Phlomoides rotata]
MPMRMLDKFEKYWFQINGIMGVATVLDPRYKLRLLHFYFPLIYTNGEDAKKGIERIQEIDATPSECYTTFHDDVDDETNEDILGTDRYHEEL